jgi:hypothetical protein
VLRETGFAETASLPGLIGPTGGEGQIGLLARKFYQEVAPAETRLERPEEKSWLVFADVSGVGDGLVSRCANLAPGAASPRRETISSSMATTLLPCDRGTLEDWQKLVKDCQGLLA